MRNLLLADPEQGGAGSAICFCQVPAIDQISCLLSLHAHWLACQGHQQPMPVLCLQATTHLLHPDVYCKLRQSPCDLLTAVALPFQLWLTLLSKPHVDSNCSLQIVCVCVSDVYLCSHVTCVFCAGASLSRSD